MENPTFRVLFVCMGNICRSPAAEIILRRMIDAKPPGRDIRVDSAGTIGYHQGSAPDPRMADALRARGYTVSGTARRITEQDLLDQDLIITMDEENLHYVQELAAHHKCTAKILPLVHYCCQPHPGRVPDPYYGGPKGFEKVIDILEDGCTGISSSLGSC